MRAWSVPPIPRGQLVRPLQRHRVGHAQVDPRPRAARAPASARQGGVNMITWEPWAKPVKGVHDAHQPRARLQTIIEGRHDRYIEEWARAAAAYRGPLLIRFLHEMNGDWYPWAYGTNGNTMPDVIAAWRHVHDVFARAGATNVRWVWTINGFAGLEDPERNLELIYPGSRYVDWVSATGFNWGRGHPRRSVQTVFDSTLRSLDRLGKPIMLSEVGTVANRGDPGAWIRQALYDLPRSFPRLKAIVWFDDRYNLRSDFSLRGRNGKAFDSIVARDPALRAPAATHHGAGLNAAAVQAGNVARQSRSLSTSNHTTAWSRGSRRAAANMSLTHSALSPPTPSEAVSATQIGCGPRAASRVRGVEDLLERAPASVLRPLGAPVVAVHREHVDVLLAGVVALELVVGPRRHVVGVR